MLKNSLKIRPLAFTLIEVLIGLAMVAVIVVLFLPRLTHKDPTFRPECMSNLKQTGLGMWMWASDHDDKFPWQTSVTNDGAMELLTNGQASAQFRPLAEFMPDDERSRIFVCPADSAKTKGASIKELREENVSYLVNADAATNAATAQTIMAGDRNLQSDGQPVKPGLFWLTQETKTSWTEDIHLTGGNLVFLDGHVEWVGTNQAKAVFMKQPAGTSRLLVP